MRYKFEDIAINSTAKKKPTAADKYTYLGLEHLDSGNLTVTRFGSDVAPIGEKLIMERGDVLFGKRRAYQKKVAIAPFDGIFSAHGMVLRPKENVVDKSFFPLFISSDYFLDAAIKISVGSLSPTINWRDLKELEFNLPPLIEQRKLAELLWAANSARAAYKELLAVTDELVKAQFVEIFGDPVTNPMGWDMKTLDELFSHIRNGANIKQDKTSGGLPITRIETISDKIVDRSKMGYAGMESASKFESYILEDCDILMSHINSIAHLGKSAIYRRFVDETIIHGMNVLCLRPKVEKINPIFIWEFFQSDWFKECIARITKPAVNQASFTTSDLKQILAYLPPLPLQNRFADFVRQADKSKLELKRTLDELDATYKAILRENLG